MPSPTRGQVKARVQVLLDDFNGTVYSDTAIGGNPSFFQQGFTQAYDDLFNAALQGQIPLDEQIVNNIHLTAGTASFNPVTFNILDMADYIRLEERTWGSTEKFTELYANDQIPQRDPTSRLQDFTYRNNQFYFVSSAAGSGATTDRELQLTYRSSGSAPTSDNTIIQFDGCLNFLALATASILGPIKGDKEVAEQCRLQAYGAKYDDDGSLGGELKRIVDNKIRSEQKTPLAVKPYSVYRSRLRRRVPYVAAQTAVGQGPITYSTANGTLTGAVDGVNTQFLMPQAISSVLVFMGGIAQAPTLDIQAFAGGNAINFLVAPPSGSVITVEAWV